MIPVPRVFRDLWLAEGEAARLWAIDRTGAAQREIAHHGIFIGRLEAERQPRIALGPPPGRRGFYRFDMQIMNRAGETLGDYGAYFKVVRPFWRVKLGLTRKTVRPGQRVLSRVENYGSKSLTYGEEFSVQRLEHRRWVRVPALTPNNWLLWLDFLEPGYIGRSSSVAIPRGTPPGRYRIVKSVGRPAGRSGSRSI